jgi:hypothetical protein
MRYITVVDSKPIARLRKATLLAELRRVFVRSATRRGNGGDHLDYEEGLFYNGGPSASLLAARQSRERRRV